MAFMGPELHPAVSLCLSETHAGFQQPVTKTPAAGFGHKQKKPQFGRRFIEPDAKHGPQPVGTITGNPPAFASGIMICNERVQDLRHQRTKGCVKPLLFCVVQRMLCDQPVTVRGLKCPYGCLCHSLSKQQSALPFKHLQGSDAATLNRSAPMGIDTESDIEANLQIGPTDKGMVRIYVEADGVEIPMDFSPDDAEEIAEEISAAAARARRASEARR